MKEKQHTDNLIREKLEGFSAEPPSHVWENIQGRLAAQKRKNRKIFIGWVLAAAVLLIAMVAGWYFAESPFNKEHTQATTEITPESVTPNENQPAQIDTQYDTDLQASLNKTGSENTGKTGLTAELPLSSKSRSQSTQLAASSLSLRENVVFTKIEKAKARIKQEILQKTVLAEKIITDPLESLTEQDRLLIAQNIITNKTESKTGSNWKMGMYLSPGYSSYTSSHSESYSQKMTYSGSGGNTNMSGGFSVQYKTGSRWSVESGIYYAQNGQQSENSLNLFGSNKQNDNSFAPTETSYFSNAVQIENNNMSMNSIAGVIDIKETPKGAEISREFDALKVSNLNMVVPNGEFSQVFQFIEIPLYARYQVLDSKFGVELITGLNAGIVVGNDAFINNQYGLQNIGETRDITPVNFSGTVGVGLNYALGKHFAIALEPRFNYYLNSINSNPSVDFRPYRIGFYTGLTYDF